MKNTAGMTSVEYEIRMTDSKVVNVYHKSTIESPYNPDLVSVGTFNTFSNNDFEVGPGHVTVTLIVTLTLLLTLLAAVAILYRTIQKRIESSSGMGEIPPDHLPVETPLSRVKNLPFFQNNMTEQLQQQHSHSHTIPASNYVPLPSELSVLRSQTIDRRHLHGNNLKNSSSDSAFNVIASFNGEGVPIETAYQYMTVARNNRIRTEQHSQHRQLTTMGDNTTTNTTPAYCLVSKSATTTRPLKTVNEATKEDIPRYCTPNITNISINRDTERIMSSSSSSPSKKQKVISSSFQQETLPMLTDCSHHCLNEEWMERYHHNHLQHDESADDDDREEDDQSEDMNHSSCPVHLVGQQGSTLHEGHHQQQHCPNENLNNRNHSTLPLSFCNSTPSSSAF